MGTNPNRSGQAMTEFLVGLVVVLALCVGLFQLVSLATANLEAMTGARAEAGRRALAGTVTGERPQYIDDWSPGDDGRTYSKDDEPGFANAEIFQARFPDRAAQVAADWDVMRRVPNNAIVDVRDTGRPVDEFGLVSASEGVTVPLLPGVRHLIYAAEDIAVEETVWMTAAGNIY